MPREALIERLGKLLAKHRVEMAYGYQLEHAEGGGGS
jgi:hypothetical protein